MFLLLPVMFCYPSLKNRSAHIILLLFAFKLGEMTSQSRSEHKDVCRLPASVAGTQPRKTWTDPSERMKNPAIINTTQLGITCA